MVQDLNNLQPTKLNINLNNYNFLIYSEPGMGKTTFATQLFPEKSLILGSELGYKGIPNVYGVPVPDYISLKQYVDQLDTDEVKAKFDTLIIDTVTKFGEIVEQYVLSIFGKETISDCKAHGGAYPLINRYYNKQFDRLKERGYNFVYICHNTEIEVKDNNNIKWIKNEPKISDRLNSMVSPEVDFIFYITTDGEGNRMLVTDKTPYNVGKQRIKLPTFLPLNAKAFKDEFTKSIKEISHNNYNDNITKNTVLGYKNSIKNYKEILNNIYIIYESLKKKELETKAIEIVNNILGKDDFGNQRTLENMTQNNVETLELILIELEKILKEEVNCQIQKNIEEPK